VPDDVRVAAAPQRDADAGGDCHGLHSRIHAQGLGGRRSQDPGQLPRSRPARARASEDPPMASSAWQACHGSVAPRRSLIHVPE
jgi:hypothetical protein